MKKRLARVAFFAQDSITLKEVIERKLTNLRISIGSVAWRGVAWYGVAWHALAWH